MSAIQGNSHQFECLNSAVTKAKSGKFKEAGQEIERITDPSVKELAIGELGKQLVRQNRVEEALRLPMTDQISRKIVQALVEKGDLETAISQTEQNIKPGEEKSKAYAAIAMKYAETRMVTEANKYASLVEGHLQNELMTRMQTVLLTCSS